MPDLLHFPGARTAPTRRLGSVPDDSATRAEALDIRRSFIVEAPAGSGKTGLLVQRFLKLLGDPSVEVPEQVLAMTFTRKATAEMQERILRELQTAHDGTPVHDDFNQQTRELAIAALNRRDPNGQPWDLLGKPQRLNIRSILSVCTDISHALPLLSGSGTQQPIEHPGPLYQLAARRTFLALGGNDRALNEALRTLLLHRDGNLANCETLIVTMLYTREQWGELVPLDKNIDEDYLDNEVRIRLERALENVVCSGLERAVKALPEGALRYLTSFAHRHAALPGHNEKPSPIAGCVAKNSPPEAVAACLDHWRVLIALVLKPSDFDWRKSLAVSTLGFKPPKPELDYHKAFIDSIQTDALRAPLSAVLALPPARYPEEQWAVAKALFLVLRRALAELKLLFVERGKCDFSELALGAQTVLRYPESSVDTALSSGSQLRHLLVDEMQDTSTAQYELLELLTQSWDGRSQTLFLVGDPKQSIYLFRQARVERFLRTLREQRLGSLALTPLSLTSNRRSQSKLVADFNAAFSRVFPSAEETAQTISEAIDVPFVEAAPTRTQTSSDGIVWHTTILDGTHSADSKKDPSASESANLVETVRDCLTRKMPSDRPLSKDGQPKPWKVAVLARSRNHLTAVVSELKQQSIPFRAVDLDPLDERQEVLDALSLTRALLHPADRIAWLAVLRAPWCGLDLADLLTLTGEGPSADRDSTVATLIVRHRYRLSPAGQQLLNRAWPVLEAAITTLGRTPLSIHVERTWKSLGGDAALAPHERVNVQRYLSLLREMEQDAVYLDPEMLLQRLKDLYAEPLSGPDIQVDLQTIHSAKGLEWDFVFVPGLHCRPRGNNSVLLNWVELDDISPDHEAAIVLAPIWGKGDDSDQLNSWLNGIRYRRELAETKRLFYVASTRAREELHLFATLPLNAKGELTKPIATTLLNACWPTAAAHFDVSTVPVTMIPSRKDEDTSNLEHEDTLALAAVAEEPPPVDEPSARPPLIRRLPLSFDPSARFAKEAPHRLTYASASDLPQARPFERPEGSFAVRAFGNVVHRYLQLIADRLIQTDAITLAAELPSWGARLEASLRGEGLPPRDAARESGRALEALTRTLNDPVGLWLLSPHAEAASESDLTTVTPATATLRVDRTFLAGPQPLSSAQTTIQTTIWIVDFKTTGQNSLPDANFETLQRNRYSPQLEAYAAVRRKLPRGELPINLSLYFPLVGRLVYWPAGSLLDT